MEYTSFHHAAWNPLHLIGMHFTTLHGLHCIQSQCMESTAFNCDPLRHNAWNPLHSMTLHGIHCIQKGWFWPCCVKSTAFNRDALGLSAWTPQHYIWLHGLHCIISRCMESSAFNDAAWNPLHSIGMIWAMLHIIHSIQSG